MNFFLKKAFFAFVFTALTTSTYANSASEKTELEELYHKYSQAPSDINEHIPVLRQLSTECSSVVEMGVRNMIATWGILLGLTENPSPNCSYLGIDLSPPPKGSLKQAQRLSLENDISFSFWKANNMDIDIEQVDLLFIDTYHTYLHLTYELEKFSSKVNKYIAMHDTSYPWGENDEPPYYGISSEYPSWIDRDKRGLWLAVQDFLERHPEWTLHERRLNNHGFTILKRTGL